MNGESNLEYHACKERKQIPDNVSFLSEEAHGAGRKAPVMFKACPMGIPINIYRQK